MHNKKTLERDIKSLEQALLMEVHIKEILQKFRRYAKVTKHFTDALEESGLYYARISKDMYRTELRVSPKGYCSAKQDFQARMNYLVDRKALTWDFIESELIRYDYKGRLDKKIAMLEVIDKETEELEQIYNEIKANEDKFTCFSLWEAKRSIEKQLDFARFGIVPSQDWN